VGFELIEAVKPLRFSRPVSLLRPTTMY